MVTDISCIPIGCFGKDHWWSGKQGLNLSFLSAVLMHWAPAVPAMVPEGMKREEDGERRKEEAPGKKEREEGWGRGGGVGRKKPLALSHTYTHTHTYAEAYPGLYSMTVERFSQDLDRSDMDKLRLVSRPLWRTGRANILTNMSCVWCWSVTDEFLSPFSFLEV